MSSRYVLVDVVQAPRDLRWSRDGLREVLADQPDQRPQVAGDDLLREVTLRRELRVDGLENLAEGSPTVRKFDCVVEPGAGSQVGPEADDLLSATQLELFRVQQAGRVDEGRRNNEMSSESSPAWMLALPSRKRMSSKYGWECFSKFQMPTLSSKRSQNFSSARSSEMDSRKARLGSVTWSLLASGRSGCGTWRVHERGYHGPIARPLKSPAVPPGSSLGEGENWFRSRTVGEDLRNSRCPISPWASAGGRHESFREHGSVRVS